MDDGVPICCIVRLPLIHQDLSDSWIPCYYVYGGLKYKILFIVPPLLVPRVNNNNTLSSLVFRIARCMVSQNICSRKLQFQNFVDTKISRFAVFRMGMYYGYHSSYNFRQNVFGTVAQHKIKFAKIHSVIEISCDIVPNIDFSRNDELRNSSVA